LNEEEEEVDDDDNLHFTYVEGRGGRGGMRM